MQDRKIAKLLEDVRLIIATNYAESFKQGKAFNIFRVQGIASDEVKVCRFIRELLDPKGSHGQGDIFLRSFMEDVLSISSSFFSVEDYRCARVVCEEVIPDLRRIDIVIRIRNRVFPIEVKIYAKDQNKQCEDYYEYINKEDFNAKVFYLTLDGHEPSDESKGRLLKPQYECISFSKHILRWLDNCIGMQEIEQIYTVREIVIQFRNIVRDLTRTHREKYEMEIKNMIEESYDNVVAAMRIAKVLPDIKVDKMREIFQKIKEYMSNSGLGDCIEAYDEEANIFYKRERKTWPSINYIIPVEDEKFKGKLVLRFEIEERLYFGICNWSGKDNYSIKHSDDIKKYVKDNFMPEKLNVEENSIWYWWMYLNKEKDVNFRYCNSEYERLFETEGFENYMNDVYATIDKVLKHISIKKSDKVEIKK